jgi:hypothetical protein
MKAVYTHWTSMTHYSDGYRISGYESNTDRLTIEMDMYDNKKTVTGAKTILSFSGDDRFFYITEKTCSTPET